MVFYTSILESRDRIMLMLLLFIMPSTNMTLRKELLEYIEMLFDPQVSEKQAIKVKAQEEKMIQMMGKEFMVFGDNRDGTINVAIKDKEKHENTTKHDSNPAKDSGKHHIRSKKP